MLFSRQERQIADLLAEHGELTGVGLCRASRGELKRSSIYVTLARMRAKDFVCARRKHYRLSLFGVRMLEALRMAEAHLQNAS